MSVGPGGRKLLKIQGSHPLVCRLVAADNLEALKTCKNPSLCQGDAFDSLRKKQEEALHKALSEAKEEEEKEKEEELQRLLQRLSRINGPGTNGGP